MLYFILGIIVGLLNALLVCLLYKRTETQIATKAKQILNIFKEKGEIIESAPIDDLIESLIKK